MGGLSLTSTSDSRETTINPGALLFLVVLSLSEQRAWQRIKGGGGGKRSGGICSIIFLCSQSHPSPLYHHSPFPVGDSHGLNLSQSYQNSLQKKPSHRPSTPYWRPASFETSRLFFTQAHKRAFTHTSLACPDVRVFLFVSLFF